jgi:hypothetical protein
MFKSLCILGAISPDTYEDKRSSSGDTASQTASVFAPRTTSKQLAKMVKPHRLLYPELQVSSGLSHYTEPGQQIIQDLANIPICLRESGCKLLIVFIFLLSNVKGKDGTGDAKKKKDIGIVE